MIRRPRSDPERFSATCHRRRVHRAAAEGVHIAPGPLFSASGGFRDHLRLNTGFPWTDQIEAQVTALGRLVRLAS